MTGLTPISAQASTDSAYLNAMYEDWSDITANTPGLMRRPFESIFGGLTAGMIAGVLGATLSTEVALCEPALLRLHQVPAAMHRRRSLPLPRKNLARDSFATPALEGE